MNHYHIDKPSWTEDPDIWDRARVAYINGGTVEHRDNDNEPWRKYVSLAHISRSSKQHLRITLSPEQQ